VLPEQKTDKLIKQISLSKPKKKQLESQTFDSSTKWAALIKIRMLSAGDNLRSDLIFYDANQIEEERFREIELHASWIM
jgi:hypothetical protein